MRGRSAGWLCLISVAVLGLGCAPGRVQMLPDATPEPAASATLPPTLTPTPVPPTPTPTPTPAPAVRRPRPARVEPFEPVSGPADAGVAERPGPRPEVQAVVTETLAAAAEPTVESETNPTLYWTPTPIAAAAFPTGTQSSGARVTAGWAVLGLVGLGLIVLLIGWLRRGDRRERAADALPASHRDGSLRSGVHPEHRAVHPAPEPAPVHPRPEPAPHREAEPAPRREAEPAKVLHPVIPHAVATAEPEKKAALRARRPAVKTVKLKRAGKRTGSKPAAKRTAATGKRASRPANKA